MNSAPSAVLSSLLHTRLERPHTPRALVPISTLLLAINVWRPHYLRSPATCVASQQAALKAHPLPAATLPFVRGRNNSVLSASRLSPQSPTRVTKSVRVYACGSLFRSPPAHLSADRGPSSLKRLLRSDEAFVETSYDHGMPCYRRLAPSASPSPKKAIGRRNLPPFFFFCFALLLKGSAAPFFSFSHSL